MSLTPDKIQLLLRAAEEAGWDEVRIDTGESTLVVSSDPDTTVDGAATAEDATGATATTETAAEPDTAGTDERGTAEEASAPTQVTADVSGAEVDMPVIASPSVGVFWRAPKPGAPPFVEVGDEVEPDDTVCIIEVMKLMNHIKAEISGTIVEIHPQNGEMVEFGAPLMTVEPA